MSDINSRFKDSLQKLKFALYSTTNSSAKELSAKLGFSQPKISRLLSSFKNEVLVVGKSKNTRYSFLRKINLTTDTTISEFPLFIINQNGTSIHVANLFAVMPKGFYIESKIPEINSDFYPDIPYFLDDLRPNGFLGRLIPLKNPGLDFPTDIRLWTSDACIRYWSTLGSDMVGNFIIGEKAFNKFSEITSDIPVNKKKQLYPKIAKDTLTYGTAGSSAGGEQAKFLITTTSQNNRTICAVQPLLVKFSPEGGSELAVRIKDLLIAEHLSLQTLKNSGKSAPSTNIVTFASRIFLESERFDRDSKLGGRAGVISLAAVDLNFQGLLGSNWREISAGLLKKKIISQEFHAEIVWRYYYGLLIANNDMHAYNLSFRSYGEKLLGLAPIYDMLPMQFFPKGNEIIKGKDLLASYKKPTLLPNDKQYWEPALETAKKFWNRVSKDKRISEEFKRVAVGISSLL